MKKFMVYVDDGYNCFKVAVPAKNEKDAKAYVEGNGEIIAVKDITEETPISAEKVAEALRAYGFGNVETDLITRALTTVDVAQ